MKNIINPNHNKIVLEQWRHRFNGMLHETLADRSKDLNPCWKARLFYPFKTGGKRIRALMVYAIAKAYHLNPYVMDPVASAIELVHTYSLIHDDLPAMDDDDFRRGFFSAHKAFNEADAILMGDGLLSDAFYVLSSAASLDPMHRLKLIESLSLAAGSTHLVYGQWLDLYQNIASYADLCQLHYKKTGTMFSFCLLSGAIVSGNPQDIPLLSKIGQDIGLAFQIQDDVLDTLPMSCTGKSSGKDKKHGKKTILSFVSLTEAERISADLYRSAIESLQRIFPHTAEEFVNLINLLKCREH